MSRKNWLTLGGLLSSSLLLLILAFILLSASSADETQEVWIAATLAPTLPPLVLTVENSPTPQPSPTPAPSLTPSLVPTVDAAALPTVPFTALQPATLPVSEFGSSGGGGSNGAAALPPGVNTSGRCVGVTDGSHVNIRDYPGLTAGVQGTMYPNQSHEIIAFAYEADALWYALPRGWVTAAVVAIYGDTCHALPDASKVAWRSFGHVDFASTARYREVKNLRVERYMLNYPMLIFENGTIWYNPNGYNIP